MTLPQSPAPVRRPMTSPWKRPLRVTRTAARRRGAAGRGACSSPRRRPWSCSAASGSRRTCPWPRGSTLPGWSVSPRTRWRFGSRTTGTSCGAPARRCSCGCCCRTGASGSRCWCGEGVPASRPASLCAPSSRCCAPLPARSYSTPGSGAGEARIHWRRRFLALNLGTFSRKMMLGALQRLVLVFSFCLLKIHLMGCGVGGRDWIKTYNLWRKKIRFAILVYNSSLINNTSLIFLTEKKKIVRWSSDFCNKENLFKNAKI